MMKKTCPFIAAALLLAACTQETYNHGFGVMRPAGNGLILFADQELDSIKFYTTDNYSITSTQPWMTPDPEWASKKVEYAYGWAAEICVPLIFEPNTTGKTREAVAQIAVKGANNWNSQGGVGIMQYGCHNILYPIPEKAKKQDNQGQEYEMTDSIVFQLTDSATQVADTLRFETWEKWTLATDASFAHLKETSGTKGYNKVAVNFDPNTTDEDREAKIVLKTRNGVSTEIKLKQTKSKKQ